MKACSPAEFAVHVTQWIALVVDPAISLDVVRQFIHQIQIVLRGANSNTEELLETENSDSIKPSVDVATPHTYTERDVRSEGKRLLPQLVSIHTKYYSTNVMICPLRPSIHGGIKLKPFIEQKANPSPIRTNLHDQSQGACAESDSPHEPNILNDFPTGLRDMPESLILLLDYENMVRTGISRMPVFFTTPATEPGCHSSAPHLQTTHLGSEDDHLRRQNYQLAVIMNQLENPEWLGEVPIKMAVVVTNQPSTIVKTHFGSGCVSAIGEWANKHMAELIILELDSCPVLPNGAQGTRDVTPGKTSSSIPPPNSGLLTPEEPSGIARIVEALQCHMWPELSRRSGHARRDPGLHASLLNAEDTIPNALPAQNTTENLHSPRSCTRLLSATTMNEPFGVNSSKESISNPRKTNRKRPSISELDDLIQLMSRVRAQGNNMPDAERRRCAAEAAERIAAAMHSSGDEGRPHTSDDRSSDEDDMSLRPTCS
eukprot:GHVT01017254.1.p1 GENE.GHVT01017254.1~~GHVT01017254.1.p1  ORF type:complete len:486 (+),score=9.53 GHVT01017254.1:827-2284(+)